MTADKFDLNADDKPQTQNQTQTQTQKSGDDEKKIVEKGGEGETESDDKKKDGEKTKEGEAKEGDIKQEKDDKEKEKKDEPSVRLIASDLSINPGSTAIYQLVFKAERNLSISQVLKVLLSFVYWCHQSRLSLSPFSLHVVLLLFLWCLFRPIAACLFFSLMVVTSITMHLVLFVSMIGLCPIDYCHMLFPIFRSPASPQSCSSPRCFTVVLLVLEQSCLCPS